MAGLNLNALKQVSVPTPTAGLTIQSEASSTIPQTIVTPQVTDSVTPAEQKAPEKPRANKISLASLRGGKTPTNEATQKTEAIADASIMTDVSKMEPTPETTELADAETVVSPAIEPSVIEAETVVTSPASESTSVQETVLTETTNEEATSIMPIEEAIVSTPAPAPIELPKEFFPGLGSMDDLNDVEDDILKLETDVHMSEVVIERVIQWDLTAEEAKAAKAEATIKPASIEQPETIEAIAEVAEETTVTGEMVEALDTEVATEEIAIVDEPEATMTVETTEPTVTEWTAATETIKDISGVIEPDVATSTDTTNSVDSSARPTPEYVRKVKEFLSSARIGGFKHFSARNRYIIAGVGTATLLGVAAWVIMDHMPKPTEFAPVIKTSVHEAVERIQSNGPKSVEPKPVPQPQPSYSAGQDYTVIKNTKKNRKSTPIPAPTEGRPLPPSTADIWAPVQPIAPPIDTVSDMPPAPTPSGQ